VVLVAVARLAVLDWAELVLAMFLAVAWPLTVEEWLKVDVALSVM
jgi:hypothetical protein